MVEPGDRVTLNSEAASKEGATMNKIGRRI